MNEFLRNHQEINEATQKIRANGWVEHEIDCKNWDIAKVMPYIHDGNFLDMGSMGSSILYSVMKLGVGGMRCGIDLGYEKNHSANGIEYFRGDLMKTPLEGGIFKYITCLSTIEHGVDFDKFAQEASRLLCINGRVFLTFDYWDPKVGIGLKWGGLDWNILCRKDVERLIDVCSKYNLVLDEGIDWWLEESVISPSYYSGGNVSYTFGFFTFVKI